MAGGSLSRRGFLAGSAALLAAGGTAAYFRSTRDEGDFPEVAENSVQLEKNGKSVLIVGGGLSGLLAACDLLDRGFAVTILEKNATAGGKLVSWRDAELGTPPNPKPLGWPGHVIEHGTHGIWSFYRNFRETLRRRKLAIREKSVNAPLPFLNYCYPSGIVDDREQPRWPAPWHATELFRGLKGLKPEDRPEMGLGRISRFMAFDASDPEEVSRLDSISMADWLGSQGYSEAFTRAAIDPILDMANFHPATLTSALAWHRLTSGCFGSWRDLFRVQFFLDSPYETIVKPLVDYLLANGGRILYLREAEAFETSGGELRAVRTRADEGKSYVCPICGQVHSGPPERCVRCGYRGSFVHEAIASERHAADYFLVAVDIPGARRIFAREPFAAVPVFQRAAKLPTAPVVIAYLWYPRARALPGAKTSWNDQFGSREVIYTNGFPVLGTTINLSLAKPAMVRGIDADLVETQISRTESIAGLSNREVCERVDRDLRSLIPGLPGFTDFRVLRWDHFTTQTVGAESLRPPSATPFRNLLLLGDYVALDHNAVYMEKVTVVAKQAVNRLLELSGTRGGRMRVLPSETPNLVVDGIRRLVRA